MMYGNPDAFFNVIYGDKAMRNADFAFKSFYEKANAFKGIPRLSYDWDDASKNL